MRHKEHFRTAVYGTPFHERTAPLNVRNEWHRWKDYTTSTVYFDEALRPARPEACPHPGDENNGVSRARRGHGPFA